jgi:hypothetical protein
MSALAAAVPNYINCVTIVVDDDKVGRRHGYELAKRLRVRGLRVELLEHLAIAHENRDWNQTNAN